MKLGNMYNRDGHIAGAVCGLFFLLFEKLTLGISRVLGSANTPQALPYLTPITSQKLAL